MDEIVQGPEVASTGDAYAGDALLATAGLHYEIDTIGSNLVGTK